MSEFVASIRGLFRNATKNICCSWPRPHPARHFRFWWDATEQRAADAIWRAAQTPASRARMSRPDSWPPCYRRRPPLPTKLLAPLQGAELFFTPNPGRRSRTRFALGYHLSGCQPCESAFSRRARARRGRSASISGFRLLSLRRDNETLCVLCVPISFPDSEIEGELLSLQQRAPVEKQKSGKDHTTQDQRHNSLWGIAAMHEVLDSLRRRKAR